VLCRKAEERKRESVCAPTRRGEPGYFIHTLNITDLYGEKYGVGIVLASNHGIGRYEMA
jgi:hypothetical protein